MNGGPRQREGRLKGRDVRRAMRWANANAALWAVGNGLVSTTLVIYLALGWLGRTLVEFMVARLIEPGATRLRDLAPNQQPEVVRAGGPR